MVRRQHATPELKHPFLHRQRIRVPSKRRVRLSKVVHGRACTSSQTKPLPSESSHRMQPVPPLAALTYVRMVRRQHATLELKHPLHHRKRIRVPSKRIVRLSKVAHGLACTSSQTKPLPSQSTHRMQPIPPLAALTYVRMVRRQHATQKLKHPLTHRKRIRVPSKRRVRLSKVVHGRACTSSQSKPLP
jgi:DNA-binding transcriptional regulator/RsmH inhibitor MraZ